MLNGDATFAGPVLINAGTLKIGSTSATLTNFTSLGTPTAITVASGVPSISAGLHRPTSPMDLAPRR